MFPYTVSQITDIGRRVFIMPRTGKRGKVKPFIKIKSLKESYDNIEILAVDQLKTPFSYTSYCNDF